jgi:hypothetical protein
VLRLDAALAAALARRRATALKLFQQLLHSRTPAQYVCFRPKQREGLDLGLLLGGANIVHSSVRRSRHATDSLDPEQVGFLADAIDIEAAERVLSLHGAVEVVDAVAVVALDRREDDLDLVARCDDVAALRIVLQRAAAPLPDLAVLVDDDLAGVPPLAGASLECPFATEILRDGRFDHRCEGGEQCREKASLSLHDHL